MKFTAQCSFVARRKGWALRNRNIEMETNRRIPFLVDLMASYGGQSSVDLPVDSDQKI